MDYFFEKALLLYYFYIFDPSAKNNLLWHNPGYLSLKLDIPYYKTRVLKHLPVCGHAFGTLAAIYKVNPGIGSRCSYRGS